MICFLQTKKQRFATYISRVNFVASWNIKQQMFAKLVSKMPCLVKNMLTTFLVMGSLQFDNISSGSSVQFHDLSGSEAEHRNSRYDRPKFLFSEDDIVVQEGQHAFFNCRVKHLRNETVVWVRNTDSHMLFIGDGKFVEDSRFSILQSSSGGIGEWTMRLQFSTKTDEGNYECQISTSPKLSKIFHLNVIIPTVKIQGDREMYVESGSRVALRCIISHWLTKPRVVFWYRNGVRLVSGIQGFTTHEEQRMGGNRAGGSGTSSVVSQLTIDRAHAKAHTGRYQCAPDNIQPAVVNLHVIRDENPAAMQRDVTNVCARWIGSIHIIVLSTAMLIVHD